MGSATLYLVIGSGLIILWLVMKVALLNARLEGLREGQRQIVNSSYPTQASDHGWLKFLAVVGFLSVCGLCLYLGWSVSALVR